METRKFTRRQVIATTSAGAIGTMINWPLTSFSIGSYGKVKLANGATRSVYHLYSFRYIKEEFNNVPKEKFIRALEAEGIPCGGGYGPQNKDGLIEEAFNSRGYKRLFSESRLNKWREENHLPGNDQLCKEAVTFYQSMLLGSRSDMDDIVNAITKIYENRDSLAG